MTHETKENYNGKGWREREWREIVFGNLLENVKREGIRKEKKRSIIEYENNREIVNQHNLSSSLNVH
tara:strand:- start:274 stop:474 length:201 start_codon:yes stop_codon:yes gene_type:complete